MGPRVLTVIETLGRGGAEHLVSTTHAHLAGTGIEARVATLWGDDALASDIEASGAEVVPLGGRSIDDLPRLTHALRAVVRDWAPHVVHTHLFGGNVAGRLAAAGHARVVTTLHNPDYGQDRGEGLRYAARVAAERATLRLSHRYLAVSRHVADDYERELGLRGVEVLPNWIDVAALDARLAAWPRSRAESWLQQRWAENASAPEAAPTLNRGAPGFRVLHVGRLHHQKGQELLVDVWPQVVQRVGPAELILVGDGPDARALRDRAEARGVSSWVRFAGAVPDVAPYLAAADLFVFPSRFEAFGIALVEAMAARLPTLVSDVAGIDEVATPETSRILSRSVPDLWVQAITELGTDAGLRTRMGEAGRRRALDFDVTDAVHHLVGIYREEAARAPRPWAPGVPA